MITLGIVEDNSDFREELAFQLSSSGFEVVFEDNGNNVDAKLRAHPCEILLLDLGLPKEDGTEIAKRVRKSNPHMGIVMVTARSTMTDKLEGLNLGADAYLIKPIHIEELIATIHALHRRTYPGQIDKPIDQQGWELHLHTLRLHRADKRYSSHLVKCSFFTASHLQALNPPPEKIWLPAPGITGIMDMTHAVLRSRLAVFARKLKPSIAASLSFDLLEIWAMYLATGSTSLNHEKASHELGSGVALSLALPYNRYRYC